MDDYIDEYGNIVIEGYEPGTGSVVPDKIGDIQTTPVGDQTIGQPKVYSVVPALQDGFAAVSDGAVGVVSDSLPVLLPVTGAVVVVSLAVAVFKRFVR